MSIAGVIDPEMNHHKKSFHRRNNDSGELDVFEASRYFSGYNEAVLGYNYNYSYNYNYTNASTYTQNNSNKIMMMRSEEIRHGHNGARISLDMPIRTLLPQQFHHHHHGVVVEKQIINNNSKEKKNKQPSSPGGRLASFLNSLFSQSASRKKKSKSTSQSMKDHHEDESPGGGRRRRRSSISHFRSSSSLSTADSNSNSKSTFSSLSSGFRTPPYVVQTPTKSCKDFRTSMSEQKQQQYSVSLSSTKYNNIKGQQNTKPTTLQSEILDEKKKRDTILLDDSYNNNNKQSTVVLSEKQRNLISDLAEKEKLWLEKFSVAASATTAAAEEEQENKEKIRKFSDEVDDGADSDSSSDLFELQNYDLGYYSSGLPVYETTNMDSIKRGAPISN